MRLLMLSLFSFSLFVSCSDKSNQIFDKSEQISVLNVTERAPWSGNKLGLEDEVISPWTPVQASNGVVKVWGREFIFLDSPLPSQIVSQGKGLLTRPLSIKVNVDGTDLSQAHKMPVITVSSSGTSAEVHGSILFSLQEGGSKVLPGAVHQTNSAQMASANIQGRQLRFKIHSLIEFDGLELFEISMVEGNEQKVDELSVEIPIRESQAIYRHRWSPTFAGLSGALPTGTGVIDSSQFIPFYWLGDNERGLFWFSESDEMWPNGKQKDAIEVIRKPGEVLLRLNIKKKGQMLPPDWHFVFGLQPTPVKPLPEGWRKWRIAPAKNATIDIIWPEPRPNSLKYYGYPEAFALCVNISETLTPG